MKFKDTTVQGAPLTAKMQQKVFDRFVNRVRKHGPQTKDVMEADLARLGIDDTPRRTPSGIQTGTTQAAGRILFQARTAGIIESCPGRGAGWDLCDLIERKAKEKPIEPFPCRAFTVSGVTFPGNIQENAMKRLFSEVVGDGHVTRSRLKGFLAHWSDAPKSAYESTSVAQLAADRLMKLACHKRYLEHDRSAGIYVMGRELRRTLDADPKYLERRDVVELSQPREKRRKPVTA